jgi:ABC-type uncharacterized transport system permease subunit
VPAKAIVGLVDAQSLALIIGAALVAIAISRAFWKRGLRSYTGASA